MSGGILPLIPCGRYPGGGYGMENQLAASNGSPSAVMQPDPDVYDDGFLRIEHNAYYVSCNGTALVLSRKEFLILSRLARNAGRIIPMRVLWDHVWGKGRPFNAVTLRVYVSHLRKKLLPFGLNIRTLISVGYYLCVPPNAAGGDRIRRL
jgi:DNA-binding response OmpR family regulator